MLARGKSIFLKKVEIKAVCERYLRLDVLACALQNENKNKKVCLDIRFRRAI